MTNDLVSQIRSNYSVFTAKERAVADYVLQNPDIVTYMSIIDLAEACNVGDTSVFRFCKKIGLSGFIEFRLRMAQSAAINSEDTPQIFGEVTLSDPVDVVLNKSLSSTINALQETCQLLHPDAVNNAVDHMVDAGRILFIGGGSSTTSALESKYKFMRITNKVDYAHDYHTQSVRASLLSENDLAVIFSYSGATAEITSLARICKKARAKIVGITRFANSPLAKQSDILLLHGANEGPFQGGSFAAKISQFFILDVLFTNYFIKTADQSKKNMETVANSAVISDKK